MFRLAICIAVGIGAGVSPALAVDWSAKTSLSETFEANDNYFLVAAPKGNLYGSTSAVFLDVTARTPTSKYILNGDFAYIHYMGPGAGDTTLTTVTQNGVGLTAEYTGHQPGDKLVFTSSWRRQDIAAAQLNDIGIATTQGETDSFSVGSSFVKQLSAVDTLSFGTTATSVDYTAENTPPYRNLTTGPTWTRRLNSFADWVSLADLSWTVWDDASHSDTKFVRAMTGLRLHPTSRLSLSASVGYGVVNSTSTEVAAGTSPLSTTGFGTLQGNGSSSGYLADGQAVYKLWSTTELTATASRAITMGVLGDLSLRTSYGLGLTHQINATSSISVNGELSKITGSGSSYEFWTVAAGYERRLSREWRTNLSYVYRQRNSDLDPASSNGVIFVLARDVTLLP